MVLSLVLFLPQLCNTDPSVFFRYMTSINNNDLMSFGPTNTNDPRLLLTPSQVVADTKNSTTTPAEKNDEILASRRSRRRKRPLGKNKKKNKSQTDVRNNRSTTSCSLDPANFPTIGNAPDIYWRSVPIEHLRLHPQFKALPDPKDITLLQDLDDVRLFRQESWQWDALHVGRCTTSQAISALGFLEPHAAQILKVPVWWQKKSAFVRLRQRPLRTLDDMNHVLCRPNPLETSEPAETMVVGSHATEGLWVPPEVVDSNFSMEYTYDLTGEEQEMRRQYAQRFSKDLDRGRFLSRWWGETQEATSLLTAINYFGKQDGGFVLEETGMCGASHTFNQTSADGMLIGATPDGIMRHSDGRVEALEVKNHCPFIAPYALKRKITKKSRKTRNKLYAVGSRDFDVSKGLVFPYYVPQLQLEMYCLGEECRSAVMIRQTARHGALIVRMRRDDEWIAEMLYWLNRYQTDFVAQGIPPEENFFWNNPSDRSRYQEFVQSTKAKSLRDVELVDRVPFEEIQRMGLDCPLFLD